MDKTETVMQVTHYFVLCPQNIFPIILKKEV